MITWIVVVYRTQPVRVQKIDVNAQIPLVRHNVMFTGTPFPHENIYGNAVPTRFRTTTPLSVPPGLRLRSLAEDRDHFRNPTLVSSTSRGTIQLPSNTILPRQYSNCSTIFLKSIGYFKSLNRRSRWLFLLIFIFDWKRIRNECQGSQHWWPLAFLVACPLALCIFLHYCVFFTEWQIKMLACLLACSDKQDIACSVILSTLLVCVYIE